MARPRPGGVNEPINNWRLVEQDIQVRATGGSNWRQRYDVLNGMGSVFYTKIITQAHGAYRSHYITNKKDKKPKRTCSTLSFRLMVIQ